MTSKELEQAKVHIGKHVTTDSEPDEETVSLIKRVIDFGTDKIWSAEFWGLPNGTNVSAKAVKWTHYINKLPTTLKEYLNGKS